MENLVFYTTYDLPIPYKSLLIYPVTVKDYLLFSIFSQCLLIEKNTIPDPKIITMTELEYIFYLANQKEEHAHNILWFDRLLALCLKDDKSFEDIEKSIKRYNYDEKGKPYFEIGETKYNAKDFLKIKEIIAEQNELELPDENISKEVRDKMEEAKRYREKMSKSVPATLEDYLVSLSIATGWSLDYIYSMTIRKFFSSLKRMDSFVHYKIYLTASLSGFVEFKDKSFIKHWLDGLEKKGKYQDVSVDLDSVQEKLSFESAKK